MRRLKIIKNVSYFPLCLSKQKPPRIDGRGVGNQYIIDSVAFGLPLLYNEQPPDHYGQG